MANGERALRAAAEGQQGRRWTLLVQSVDLHSDAASELMQLFRFIPDARLDDVMISIASHGGGVGPHFDSYDVFLLQAAGDANGATAARRTCPWSPACR